MKLLITGGAGFIGSNFVHYWHKKYPQDTIVVYDALTYAGNIINLSSVLGDDFSQLSIDEQHDISSVTGEKSKVQFIKGDISDVELVNIWMERIDVVVHFAAESHVDRSILGPATF